ncbi:unnamed protein product [Withania somnifera]
MKKDVVVLIAVTTVQFVRQWKRRWRHAQRILRKFARKCATPADDLVSEMQAGLNSTDQSTLQMLPSCLPSLPTDDEKGLYYEINLRGTNFIIVQARLGGRNAPTSRLRGRHEPISDLYRQEISIPPNIIEASSQERKIWEVAASRETAITWKNSLLGDAAINIQWGNFRSSHLPITEFDTSLDAESSYPGRQIFEKVISGTYLGETVRRVLLKMAQESALFGDTVPSKLAIPYSLRSPDMAAMHQDKSEDYEIIDEKLTEIFGITNFTTMERELVAEVCDVVAERGARLVGAGIVGIVKKLGRLSNRISIITVEGGVYEHYHVYRNYLLRSVWEMLGNELSGNVIIEHSHGGSGASSIFIAASQT